MKKAQYTALFAGLLFALLFTAGCGAAEGDDEAPVSNLVTIENQTLSLEGVSNARQLGGYVNQEGATVKENVLIRSGALADATEEDIARLAEEYGVTLIIDFRKANEIASAPDPEIGGARQVAIPVEQEDEEEQATTVGYADYTIEEYIGLVQAGVIDTMYIDMAEDPFTQAGYAAFFRQLLEHEEGAILWHCTGGKDRAGLAAVLLLSALGVDRETVLDDFALSNVASQPVLDHMLPAAEEAGATEEDLSKLSALFGVSREMMEEALEHIDEAYGSMHDYLTGPIGLSEEDIQALREMYLVS